MDYYDITYAAAGFPLLLVGFSMINACSVGLRISFTSLLIPGPQNVSRAYDDLQVLRLETKIAMQTMVSFVTVQQDSALFQSVLTLGDQNKQTLGLLPYGAILEYAQKGTILACIDPAHPDTALGYALYSLPREKVKLTHLVVSEDHRKSGLAMLLMDELSKQTSDRRGIRVKCRRDYVTATAFWPRAGFSAIRDVNGRGKDGHLLTIWWKDHGHADLLSWDGPRFNQVSIGIDANVYYDLIGHETTEKAVLTRHIFNEILDGDIEVLITPEMDNEVNRAKDHTQRQQAHEALSLFPRLPVSADLAKTNSEKLIVAGGITAPRPQDRSDALHIGYAAAGITVFVTGDTRARSRYGSMAAQDFGV
jgi:GNAT superfamily N-acetyltransferase